MKNIAITAVAVFALTVSTVYAGEHTMDFNNSFAYTKSTQSSGSAESAASAGSAGSSPASFEGANTIVLLGLIAFVLVCLAVCGGGRDNTINSGYED